MKEKTTISGILNIDKPSGMTSHDVVVRVRRLLTTNYKLQTKVGHTGTLDPFATGVLLVVVGPATRLIQFTHTWDKEYEATFVLGATSDTDDGTGEITKNQSTNAKQITKNQIQKMLQHFIGPIQQVPPAYSAVKIKGKKLYEYARAGNLEKVGESQPRLLTVHDIEVLEYKYPKLTLRIRCGTGTYIRSLARDVGKELGTGAYVSSLRRTRIGLFDSNKSVSLDLLSTGIQQHIHTPAELVNHLTRVTLTSHNIDMLRQGKALHLPTDSPPARLLAEALAKAGGNSIAIFDENKTLVGIATYDPSTSLLSPKINL